MSILEKFAVMSGCDASSSVQSWPSLYIPFLAALASNFLVERCDHFVSTVIASPLVNLVLAYYMARCNLNAYKVTRLWARLTIVAMFDRALFSAGMTLRGVYEHQLPSPTSDNALIGTSRSAGSMV